MADLLNDIGSGIPILRPLPTWNDGLSGKFETNQKIESFPGTIENVVTFYDERPFSVTLPFFFTSKEEEYEFIEFFYARQGRFTKFWMPSPYNFFKPDKDVLTSESFLVVEDNKFRDSFRGFERLWIETKSGDWIVAKITSSVIGPLGGQETINISTGFDRDIPVDEIYFSSFFYLGRFEFDKLELENITDTASRTTQKFIELIKEYP